MEDKLRLPKNIKQVGERDDLYRIYLEDYVYTFIKKMNNRMVDRPKVGILIGKSAVIDGVKCRFINGALIVDELWSDKGEIQFTAAAWKAVEEDIQKFFPNSSICGWFVKGDDEYKLDFIVLKQIHRAAFPNDESLLYLCRGDDFSFWIGAGDNVSSIQGYYIYYERNEEMQNYMVETGGTSPVEVVVQDAAIQNFRSIMQEKKDEAGQRENKKMYRLCVGLAIVVLALGLNTWLDKQNTPNTNTPVAATPSPSAETTTDIYIDRIPGNVETQGETYSEFASETDASIPSTDGESIAQSAADTNGKEDATDVSTSKTYIIKPGDTLIYISIDYYGTTGMVQAICELNEIENPNAIFVGQKIKLP